MSLAAGGLLLNALLLAAPPGGLVVDTVGAVDMRLTIPAAAEPSILVGVRPAAKLTLERDGLAADFSYAPQLSLLTGAPAPLVLHRAGVHARVPVGRRFTLEPEASGTAGDLDPSSAQQQLFTSRGKVNLTRAFSYGQLAAALGATFRATPRVVVDVRPAFAAEGSPFPSAASSASGVTVLPTVMQASVRAAGHLALGPASSVFADVDTRAVSRTDAGASIARDQFVAAIPRVGAQHMLWPGLAVALAGGALCSAVQLDASAGAVPVVLPVMEGRIDARADLAGDAAVEGAFSGGLQTATDPLGALLDERASLSLQGALRPSRWWALHGQLNAFLPLWSTGVRAGTPLSTAAIGAATSVIVALGKDVALETGLAVQARQASGAAVGPLQTDTSFGMALTGNWSPFHRGSRPAGSTPAPLAQVGGAPRWQRGAVLPAPEEEPPPPIEETPPEDPALVPPPALKIDDSVPPPNAKKAKRRVDPEEKSKKDGSVDGTAADGAPGSDAANAKRKKAAGGASTSDDDKDTKETAPADTSPRASDLLAPSAGADR